MDRAPELRQLGHWVCQSAGEIGRPRRGRFRLRPTTTDLFACESSSSCLGKVGVGLDSGKIWKYTGGLDLVGW